MIIQSPNFFGIVEDVQAARPRSRTRKGALLVFVFTEAVSLGLLEPPRDADIVAGELQIVRHLAQLRRPVRRHHRDARKSSCGRLPGRLVGETKDAQRQSGVLPDAGHARATHPPREGDSNICTNQALIALMATVFMTRLRQAGLARAGRAESGEGALSGRQAAAAFQRAVLQRIRGVHQWAHRRTRSIARCWSKKIIGGLPLGRFYPELENSMLLCARR